MILTAASIASPTLSAIDCRDCNPESMSAADKGIAMKAISQAASLLALAVAVSFSQSDAFAKSGGPTQVKTSGTSAGPSPVAGSQNKHRGCYQNPTAPGCRPGHTQPTCRGPHMGPNGVMIQCD
jgi:hypothetical protein